MQDKVTLGKTKQILFTPLLSQVVGHLGCQKKRNLLPFLDSLVWCAVFQSKLRKLEKTQKFGQKRLEKAIFQWFYKDCSILTEKQRKKPRKSNSLKSFASFVSLVAPKLVIIVELCSISCFVLIFCDENAIWRSFPLFQNEPWFHHSGCECHFRALPTRFV